MYLFFVYEVLNEEMFVDMVNFLYLIDKEVWNIKYGGNLRLLGKFRRYKF